MELFVLFYKTICLRPYVFAFLIAFLISGTVRFGFKKTLIFWFGTWILAFLSEFSSTRNGFPYGLYQYTGYTQGEELYISNVPFMDSLSYSFLLFASYSMALFSLSPLKVRRWDVQVQDNAGLRGGWKVLLLTAVYMMMIDVIIDPVALQGEKWFLGKIYYYEVPGSYFGVPITNALGWGFVGFVATALYQAIERQILHKTFKDIGIRKFPFRDLMGVGLYYGVLIFNLAITWKIGEQGLFTAGCFIFLIPTLLLFLRLFDPKVTISTL